jgi:hypothetical protein
LLSLSSSLVASLTLPLRWYIIRNLEFGTIWLLEFRRLEMLLLIIHRARVVRSRCRCFIWVQFAVAYGFLSLLRIRGHDELGQVLVHWGIGLAFPHGPLPERLLRLGIIDGCMLLPLLLKIGGHIQESEDVLRLSCVHKEVSLFGLEVHGRTLIVVHYFYIILLNLIQAPFCNLPRT